MSKKAGICRLCKKGGELRDSHLFPQALYRILGESKSVPIVVSPENSVRTSKQITAHLLCDSCEQLLNREGEDWVLRNTFRAPGEFKIRDVLSTASPTYFLNSGLAFEAAFFPQVRIDRLAHFASAVFWKGSVHRWVLNGRDLSANYLGARYEGEFADYILGNTGFPTNAAMLVFISDQPSPALAIIPPHCVNEGGFYLHKFAIPGILFTLAVGGKISIPFRSLCSVRSPGNLIYLSDTSDTFTDEICLNKKGLLRPVGSLAKR